METIPQLPGHCEHVLHVLTIFVSEKFVLVCECTVHV